ncbi:MAG: transposase [Spongiibacter sp.]|uniref:RNA-guided endonuclease InsQ/TnpB family protein n=1 Tax=Spongiibacter sp. TaxID=2024860 RepID=UPI000C0A2F50|nr:transposase [Spongiibacter sp.]MAK43117.1 transposase [Spongiibacter sp.]
MRRATKVRLYPTVEQQSLLDRQFGAVRFVYNKALAIMSHRYKIRGQSLRASRDIKPLLAVAKRSRKYGWLKDFDAISLQQACRNLDTAFSNFFDRALPARYPTFKRKHGKQSSYHCTGATNFDADSVTIPKIGRIPAVIHRAIDGDLKSITVSKTRTGKYYASILVEDGQDAPPLIDSLEESQVRGLDVGLSSLGALDTGEKIDNPRHLARASANLRRKQKALTRKKKGSTNRAKARLTVARCHERVANARNDFQHKLSRRLVDENQAIVVETLRIKNMMRNRRLAKAIGDAGWHSLAEKLSYKASRAGKHLVKIDQWFPSSKQCSCCHAVRDTLPLSVRTWKCACGAIRDRDTNAALNQKQQGILMLKAAGHVVTAHGGLRKTGALPAVA